MATHTQRAGHPWPFMAGTVSEAAPIKPEAWAALQTRIQRMCKRGAFAVHRTPTYALQSQDCEQRGRAVIDAAVKTLIAEHTS